MLRRRSAALAHFAASATILALLVAWVLGSLYPPPLLDLQGGAKILALLVLVDVVLGPMMTLIVYKPGKRTLLLDMTVIVVLQLAALVYGAHNIYTKSTLFLA